MICSELGEDFKDEVEAFFLYLDAIYTMTDHELFQESGMNYDNVQD